MTTELESILQTKIHLLWAGRTDSGVHAQGNVCAFDGALPFSEKRLLDLLGARLPDDVWVTRLDAVSPDWHPRYAASSRDYLYRWWLGANLPYDRNRFVWHIRTDWVAERAWPVLHRLHGDCDFAKLTKRPADDCRCRVQLAELRQAGSEFHCLLRANRFMWRMVRNLAALIDAVASGLLSADGALDILFGQEPFKLKAAPAKGLVLMSVNYA